jgi:hypothetical protein
LMSCLRSQEGLSLQPLSRLALGIAISARSHAIFD